MFEIILTQVNNCKKKGNDYPWAITCPSAPFEKKKLAYQKKSVPVQVLKALHNRGPATRKNSPKSDHHPDAALTPRFLEDSNKTIPFVEPLAPIFWLH